MAGYNNMIGYGYPNTMNYAYAPMSSGAYTQPMQQPQQQKVGIEWVDGEVGAKAYQLPQGWPANVPMPLWDTNDTVIYLKSINQMGMPNPIQKVCYTMEQRMTSQDAERVRTLFHALKSAETYYAMVGAEDSEERGGNMSGARYRGPMMGRLISRGYPEDRYSGHYPAEYIDPYWNRR